MASINSFADVTEDWEGLLAALPEHPDLLANLESERLALEQDLTEVRALKARQESLKAGRQELTQQIKTVVARGKATAITIRAVAKGKIGYRNERLVHFKVAPVRKRTRKAVVVKPPEGEPTVV
jgi:DNA repair exonuclease SbcCD ATPase subunit